MSNYTRAQIGLRPSRGRTNLNPAQVVGIALHWPAMSQPVRGVENVKAALRGWQNYHMDTNGWSDIAYQGAVDQDGNTYELRGLGTRSGANGDTDVNERYGALLLILAPGEQPTEAMAAAVRRRIADHRRYMPKSTQIVGHGQIRPGGTECPGPAVRAAIGAGRFRPQAEPPKPPPSRVQTARPLIARAADLLAGTGKGRPKAKHAARTLRRTLRRLPRR